MPVALYGPPPPGLGGLNRILGSPILNVGVGTISTAIKEPILSETANSLPIQLEKGALEFFDCLKIAPETRLLGIARGAGQLTHPAARREIKVIGLGLTANLVQQLGAKRLLKDSRFELTNAMPNLESRVPSRLMISLLD